MGSNKKHQLGFGAIGIVVILVIIVIIGSAGYIVARKTSNPKQESTTNVTMTTPAPKKSETEKAALQQSSQQSTPLKFVIPEIGVMFTIPESLKDLTYHINDITFTSGETIKGAYLSTEALTKVNSKCSAEFGPLGAMTRQEGQYPTSKQVAGDYGPLLKQFPMDFVTFEGSHADCTQSTDEKVLRLYDDSVDAIHKAIKSVELSM